MRWPTATGLWLAFPVWVYAVLGVLEVRDLAYDPTRPGPDYPDYVAVMDGTVPLVWATAIVLGPVMLLAATGRLRRTSDALLGLGLVLGGVMLWFVEEPRPLAPVVVAAAGVVLLLSAALPAPRAVGRVGSFLARLLLATSALLTSWIILSELAETDFRLAFWNGEYWLGLAMSAWLLLAAVAGHHLSRPVWRWLWGLPVLGLGLLCVVLGVVLFREGYLVSGWVEDEDSWRLGGPVLFAGCGWTTGAVAALRGTWVFAAATIGATMFLLLALLFGIPEIRRGF